MKQVIVQWTEQSTYEATITVPDDYPETVEQFEAAQEADAPVVQSSSEEDDWWERVEREVPDWATNNLSSVEERTLTSIVRVD